MGQHFSKGINEMNFTYNINQESEHRCQEIYQTLKQ